MFKPRKIARAALVLFAAALLFGPMGACYAHVRPAGGYYSSGYYGGSGYRGRDRHRHYRAPDPHYRGGGRHHHHHREHHHRHHDHGPRW